MLKEAVTCPLCTTPSLPSPRQRRLERMQKKPKPKETTKTFFFKKKNEINKRYLQVSFQKGNKNINIFIYIKMYIIFHWFQTITAG